MKGSARGRHSKFVISKSPAKRRKKGIKRRRSEAFQRLFVTRDSRRGRGAVKDANAAESGTRSISPSVSCWTYTVLSRFPRTRIGSDYVNRRRSRSRRTADADLAVWRRMENIAIARRLLDAGASASVNGAKQCAEDWQRRAARCETAGKRAPRWKWSFPTTLLFVELLVQAVGPTRACEPGGQHAASRRSTMSAQERKRGDGPRIFELLTEAVKRQRVYIVALEVMPMPEQAAAFVVLYSYDTHVD